MGSQTGRPGRIQSIDFLRVYAALTVLFGHVLHFLRESPSYSGETIAFYRQGSGALVFMAVAAFIALYGEGERFGQPGRSRAFLSKRMLRIAPLYWIFTSLWLAVAVAMPQLLDKNEVSVGHVASSYLFLPFARPFDGALRPVLSPGWTLNYIAWFYVLFAVGLAFRKRVGVGVTTGVLVALFLLGAADVGSGVWRFFTAKYVLVFALGMVSVPLFRWFSARGVAIPTSLSVLLVGGLFALSWVGGDVGAGAANGLVPGDVWAFASTWMIVLVAALTRPLGSEGIAGRAWSVLAKASYSIYLSQAFSLGLLTVLLEKGGLDRLLPFWAAVPVGLLFGLGCGVAVYYAIEKPLTTWVARSTGQAVQRAGSAPR